MLRLVGDRGREGAVLYELGSLARRPGAGTDPTGALSRFDSAAVLRSSVGAASLLDSDRLSFAEQDVLLFDEWVSGWLDRSDLSPDKPRSGHWPWPSAAGAGIARPDAGAEHRARARCGPCARGPGPGGMAPAYGLLGAGVPGRPGHAHDLDHPGLGADLRTATRRSPSRGCGGGASIPPGTRGRERLRSGRCSAGR